jgi:hypothetical protein
MTSKHLRLEIQKVIENIPDDILNDVLDFLKELEKRDVDKVALTNHLRKILTEDKDLLQRLAQ